MAARPDAYPYERNLSSFDAIITSAQRTIVAQIEAAMRSGDLQSAQGRRAQLAAIDATLQQLKAAVNPLARQLVFDAWHQAADRAEQQVAKLSIQTAEIPGAFHGVSTEAVQAMQESLAKRLDSAAQTLGRRVEDIYAREQRRAALRGILGAEGSPEAASKELQSRLLRDKDVARAVRDGKTGFVDSAGKRWSLDTYSNMAVRTVTREAVVQGAVARMVSHGIAIARVSTHPDACPVCEPFEGTLVALDGTTTSYNGEAVSDTGETPPFHPNCLVAGTRVRAGKVYGALRARYSGPVVDLTTASGVRLTVTPNHPVMTSAGWLPAGELREGQYVFSSRRLDRLPVEQHDLDNVPAPIEQVFEALDADGWRPLTATAGHDLHGDARCVEGEVDVVLADRLLLDELAAALGEQSGEPDLKRPDVKSLGLAGSGPALKLFERARGASHNRMGGVGARRADCDAVFAEALSHCARRNAGVGREPLRTLAGQVPGGVGIDVRHVNGLEPTGRLAPRPQLHAVLEQLAFHARLSRAKAARELRYAMPFGVEADQLVGVEWREFTGHVFDLSTASGMYEAETLIISNCAHSLMPVAATVEELQAELEGALA